MSEFGKIGCNLLLMIFVVLSTNMSAITAIKVSEAKDKFFVKALAFKESEICVLLDPEVKVGEEKLPDKALVAYSKDDGNAWIIIDIPYLGNPENIVFDKEGNLWVWFLGKDITLFSKRPFTNWERKEGHLPVYNDRLWISSNGNLICLSWDLQRTDLKHFGKLYESDDFGKSWRRLFYDEKEAFYTYEQKNGKDFFIKYSTKDGMQKLETKENEYGDWQLHSLFKDRRFGQDVFRLYGNSILLAGTDNNMLSQGYFSTDRGKSWNIALIHPATLKDYPYITDGMLASESKAIIVMSDRIIATTKAGKKWKCVWGPKKGCWLEKCYLSPKGEIWVIGNIILRSKDGIRFKEVRIK